MVDVEAGLQVVDDLPPDLSFQLTTRDAALWVLGSLDRSAQAIEEMVRLARLPWSVVLVEDTGAQFAKEVTDKTATPMHPRRGHVMVIAQNPADAHSTLPHRSLPVFLMNGREDGMGDESTQLSSHARTLRRANMVQHLISSRPRLLAVTAWAGNSRLDEILTLRTQGELESALLVFSTDESVVDHLREWRQTTKGGSAITVCRLPQKLVVERLERQLHPLLAEQSLVISYRGKPANPDISRAEIADRPLLDRYDVIRSRDLPRLTAQELPEAELNAFFSATEHTWRPYAAGLPWPRFPDAMRSVVRTLEKTADKGPEGNKVLFLRAESGAGGTTLARTIAFEAAQRGYPTLVAKNVQFLVDVGELSRFMFDAWTEITAQGQAEQNNAAVREQPWLVVFDVGHFLGREGDLVQAAARLSHDGRPAVLLAVVQPSVEVKRSSQSLVLPDVITHDMRREDAIALGEHLNAFLSVRNRQRQPQEWVAFWEAHTPKIGDFGIGASFWIALDFWLKRQLDLGQSIQQWLWDQFTRASLDNTVVRTILQIAAMSIERQCLPEALLPSASPAGMPYSVLLDEARQSIPALTLWRAKTATDAQWAIVHDSLARYLIVSASRDRSLLAKLGLPEIKDAVSLRLRLLRELATRKELGTPRFMPLAVEFAINILKLDREGNREFFGNWREVLRILEDMPEPVWNSSRLFNHHVAISRRRVANDPVLFELTNDERLAQLATAVEHLEFAINELDPGSDDEQMRNLFNSLTRAYQDLIRYGTEIGLNAEQISEWRRKARATRDQARAVDPDNSHVLETVARDYLQEAASDSSNAVAFAVEALSCIHQAMTLDDDRERQRQLADLLTRALRTLQDQENANAIAPLRNRHEEIGFLASAWLRLGTHLSMDGRLSFDRLDPSQLEAAMAELTQIRKRQSPLTGRLEYAVVAALHPVNFERQLDVLTALEGLERFPSLQLDLEKAILLYQVGRPNEGSEIFRSIRHRLAKMKTEGATVILEVPERLRTLWQPGRFEPLVCQATVLDKGDRKPWARVRDLKNEEMPFKAMDFGLRPGQRINCEVSFGPNGPQARAARG